MNGPIFVDAPDTPVDERITGLIESAAANIDFAADRLDPAEGQAAAQIALAQIALATFLRGGR